MLDTRRSFLRNATAAGTILTVGCLDAEGEEPTYISVSNRYEDQVMIDVMITNVDTGEVVYDEALEFDGFAGAEEDGSPPRKQPDLGIEEAFEATVTVVTDWDSNELTGDIGPSGGSWISVLHGSDAKLNISKTVV